MILSTPYTRKLVFNTPYEKELVTYDELYLSNDAYQSLEKPPNPIIMDDLHQEITQDLSERIFESRGFILSKNPLKYREGISVISVFQSKSDILNQLFGNKNTLTTVIGNKSFLRMEDYQQIMMALDLSTSTIKTNTSQLLAIDLLPDNALVESKNANTLWSYETSKDQALNYLKLHSLMGIKYLNLKVSLKEYIGLSYMEYKDLITTYLTHHHCVLFIHRVRHPNELKILEFSDTLMVVDSENKLRRTNYAAFIEENIID